MAESKLSYNQALVINWHCKLQQVKEWSDLKSDGKSWECNQMLYNFELFIVLNLNL